MIDISKKLIYEKYTKKKKKKKKKYTYINILEKKVYME